LTGFQGLVLFALTFPGTLTGVSFFSQQLVDAAAFFG
jgi:hypothetical protein